MQKRAFIRKYNKPNLHRVLITCRFRKSSEQLADKHACLHTQLERYANADVVCCVSAASCIRAARITTLLVLNSIVNGHLVLSHYAV